MLDEYDDVENQPKLEFDRMHHRFWMDTNAVIAKGKTVEVKSTVDKGRESLAAFINSRSSTSQVPPYVHSDPRARIQLTHGNISILERSHRRFMKVIPGLRRSNWRDLVMHGSFRVSKKSRSLSYWAEGRFLSIHWTPRCVFSIPVAECAIANMIPERPNSLA